MRVVFMGTPEFAARVLEALLESAYQVVAVYTQPDRPAGRGKVLAPSPVKAPALKHGIPVFQPAKLRGAAEVERLASLKPDVVVVAAFGQILTQDVLDIPRFGCLNVHASLLPRYRGASPVTAAILAGDEKTGVTIMKMDAGMDTGPAVSQAELAIDAGDTTGSLAGRLAGLGARLLLDTLPLWFEGKIVPQPQDESKTTYTSPVSKSDGEIRWELGALRIWRMVRAFQPWPGSYTWWQGKTLKIIEAVPLPAQGALTPGKVVALTTGPNAVGVETGDGVLGLSVVQIEGKRPLAASEFLRGQKDFVGSLLGREA